jgi:group I intron endonuclease
MLVYIYRNRINNKVYVGKTAFSLRKRHNEHLGMVRYGDKNYFHNALRKYGEENFERCIISYALSSEELDKMEIHFIQHYRANEPGYGYNLTLGGDGGVPTEAVRAKLRAARKGRVTIWVGGFPFNDSLFLLRLSTDHFYPLLGLTGRSPQNTSKAFQGD